MLRSFYLWIVILFSVTACGRGSNVVQTDKGRVQGHKIIETGIEYVAFLGIPYAAPVSGNRRFQAPLPVEKWNGIFNAMRRVSCPQIENSHEDCLILNVFTPTVISTPAPVIFIIRGGSYLYNSGATTGLAALVQNNVIVVTVNYRLGALGFLCLGIKEVPGNAGLKDLVAALEWTKNNIGNFGGDQNMITIYGCSSGAVIVELLVLSPLSKGLFRSAIIESGSIFNYWAIADNPLTIANNLARSIFYKIEKNEIDLRRLLESYRSVSLQVLNSKTLAMYKKLMVHNGTLGLTPCVEKPFLGVKAFLTEHPRDILISQSYNNVPIMFVMASLEGLNFRANFLTLKRFADKVEHRLQDFLPPDLKFPSEDVKKNVTDCCIKTVYNNVGASAINKTLGYINFFGDTQVTYGLLKSAKYHSIRANVYVMEFAYKGDLGFQSLGFNEHRKAVHNDFFYYVVHGNAPKKQDDQEIARKVINLVTNFVKFGNPTPTNSSSIRWPRVKPNKPISYLYLGKDMEIIEKPYPTRMKLWKYMYNLYGTKP